MTETAIADAPAPKSPASGSVALVLLSFLSGTCGIAYEVLYSRVLTTYLGDMFYVSASILCSFLFWLAVGALAATLAGRWLWLLEGAIGICALSTGLCCAFAGQHLVDSLAPLAAHGPGVVLFVVSAIVAVPAGLSGFSVPLFSSYLQARASSAPDGRAFASVYGAYNLGAALFVVAVELWLLPLIGIAASFCVMGSINLFIAGSLYRLGAPRAAQTPRPQDRPAPGELAALFAVSGASGIFQLLFLKISNALFGPYHENFALCIAVGLIGIWVGIVAVERWRATFRGLLLAGGGIVAAGFLLLGPEILTWCALNGHLGTSQMTTRWLKVAMLLAIGLPALSVFGATLPALMRGRPAASRAVGFALAVACLGNCAGYLATMFVLHDRFTLQFLAVLVSAIPVLAGLTLDLKLQARRLPTAMASVALAILLCFAWPGQFLELGYRNLRSPEALRNRLRSLASTKTYKKFGQSLSVMTDKRGYQTLCIEGYQALIVGPKGRANLREVLFGMAPSLFSAKRESALVLGVGTGITAGTVASLYDRTRAVEIHPAVFDLVGNYSAVNNDLLRNPKVDLVLQDGITALAEEGPQYDLICNTVTSPLYFSSSKLYTRDFLGMVKRKLAPGGVYVFWFDINVGKEGARIVFQTVASSFRHCAFLFLTRGYTQVICSQEPLQARQPPAGSWPAHCVDRLRSHDIEASPTDFLHSLLFPGDSIHAVDWRAPINTFDRPSLEFVMAWNSINEEFRRFVLYEPLGLDFGSSWLGQGPIPPKLLATRARAMKLLDNVQLDVAP